MASSRNKPGHSPRDRGIGVHEARFRAFADHVSDAFYLHGEGGVILDVNRRVCDMLGYTREELIGMEPKDFDADVAHPHSNHPSIRARLDAGKEARFDSYHRRKDGSVFPVEVRLFPYQENGRSLRLGLVSDISERKHAEEALHRLNRELRAISLCHQTLLRAMDEETLLGEVCRIICEEAGYRLAWVGYVEHDEARSIKPMGVYGDDQGYVQNLARTRLSWSEHGAQGRSPAGVAVRSGEIVYVRDIATDPRMEPWRAQALACGYRSGFALPLTDEQGSVFGVMLVYAGQIDGINSDDMRLMGDLSRDLSFGIVALRNRSERKRGEGTMLRLNRELRAVSLCHQTLLRAGDEQSLLDDICRLICEEAGYRLAWVAYRLDDEAKSLVPMALAGHDAGYMESIVRTRFTWSAESEHGRGNAGEAVRSGKVAYIPDIGNDPRVAMWRDRAIERGYRSSVALPLQGRDGTVFGVMMVYSEEVDGISSDDIRLMEELTADLSFGISVLRDREERERAERSLQALNRELRAISLCHQALLRASDEQALLDEICHIIVTEAGYRMVWVCYVEHDEAKGFRAVASAGQNAGYTDQLDISWSEESERGRGPAGIAVRTGRIVHVHNTAEDPRMGPWRDLALARGFQSSIAMPLKLPRTGEVFGILSIYASEPHAFVPEEVRLLEELTEDLAFGIDVLRTRMERRSAEEALRRNEERYRTIFENSPLGIFRSSLDGRFLEVNPAMAHILGYDSPEQIIEEITDIGEQIYFDAEERRQVVARQMRAPGDILHHSNRYRRRDGSECIADLYLKTVRDAEGRPLCFDGIFEDITDSRRAEEARERLEGQLIQAQKMESIGRLAGGVAHDFNNMLGVIIGYSDLAMGQVDEGHRAHAYLQEVRKAADRSADLTRQLLAFARKQNTMPKVLDLNDTVEGMLNMLGRLIGEEIALAWQPGDGLWQVKIDPSQLDQILANLCVNARDAIDGDGRIAIRTRNIHLHEIDSAVRPEFTAGDFVCLCVSDDGCGMDQDILQNVFEPFFTTKSTGKGTGLGLSTVYGIVKQNGGFISIDTEPGLGTTFNIFLPRHVGDAPKVTKVSASDALASGNETILLVEDEPAMLAMTQSTLQECGYRVLAAASPAEAISLAEEQAKAGGIDLLITDMVMPGMNGLDLARRIMPMFPGIHCLFMSGYMDQVLSRDGGLDASVNFIQKPFSISNLVNRVRTALDGSKPGGA